MRGKRKRGVRSFFTNTQRNALKILSLKVESMRVRTRSSADARGAKKKASGSNERGDGKQQTDTTNNDVAQQVNKVKNKRASGPVSSSNRFTLLHAAGDEDNGSNDEEGGWQNVQEEWEEETESTRRGVVVAP